MATRSDAQFQALRSEGFNGTNSDMPRDWLLDEVPGATDTQVNDLWMAHLDLQLIPAGHINDRWFSWLGGLGFTGARVIAGWRIGLIVRRRFQNPVRQIVKSGIRLAC